MLRRSFLGCAAAACLADTIPSDCGSTVFQSGYAPRLKLQLTKVPDLHLDLPKNEVARRHWKDWSIKERDRLRGAYLKLIAEAPRMAKHGRGLLYNAWWHGYFCGSPMGDDPGAMIDIHGTWAFLPWHRVFTYLHERLLAKTLHDDDFRLPVWEWDQDDKVPEMYADLPAPFVDGPPRRRSVGVKFSDCLLRAWLVWPNFIDFVGQRGGAGTAAGGAHSTVHTLLCGAMKDFPVAGVDPLFYSHHANVDRFWWHWNQEYRTPKEDPEWLNQCLYFPGLDGKIGKIQVAKINTIDKLKYRYQDKPCVALAETQAVELTAITPSNPIQAIEQAVLKEIRIAATFLAGLSPDTLRAQLSNLGQGLDPLTVIQRVFQTQSFSLRVPVASQKDMQTGMCYMVGVAKPGTSDDNDIITIAQFALFGSKPQCIFANGCLQGDDVRRLYELLVSLHSQPDVFYASPFFNPQGYVAVPRYALTGGKTSFCGPFQVIQFNESKQIVNQFFNMQLL